MVEIPILSCLPHPWKVQRLPRPQSATCSWGRPSCGSLSSLHPLNSVVFHLYTRALNHSRRLSKGVLRPLCCTTGPPGNPEPSKELKRRTPPEEIGRQITGERSRRRLITGRGPPLGRGPPPVMILLQVSQGLGGH